MWTLECSYRYIGSVLGYVAATQTLNSRPSRMTWLIDIFHTFAVENTQSTCMCFVIL